MNISNLQDALRARPFVPFRVFITDGAAYEVRHPELCVPGRRAVFIGLTDSAEAIFERYAVVDLVHITRLEPLESAKSSGNGQV